MGKLNNKCAVGPEGLAPAIVKEFKIYLVVILVYLINFSFTTGVFANVLKKSAIVPIFRNGYASVISSYRPIALNSIVSKILEYCLLNRFNSFTEQTFDCVQYDKLSEKLMLYGIRSNAADWFTSYFQ